MSAPYTGVAWRDRVILFNQINVHVHVKPDKKPSKYCM